MDIPGALNALIVAPLRRRAVLSAGLAIFGLTSGTLLAQHYTVADVEKGARLYRANCSSCHGQEGDGIPGINFRRGQFRQVYSDQELFRIVSNGIAGTAMPPTEFPAGLESLAGGLLYGD